MKKTLTILSILCTIISYSKLNGNFEISNNIELNLNKKNYKEKLEEFPLSPKVKLDLSDKDLRLDFGLEYEAKNISIDNVRLKKIILLDFNPKGNVWLKYTFPKKENIESYVKLTIEDELSRGTYQPYLRNKVFGEIEFNTEYNYYDYIWNFNTKNKTKLHDIAFPAFKTPGYRKIITKTNIDDFESIHSLSLKKDRLAMFKDFKSELSLKHYWGDKGIEYVKVEASANFDGLKEFDLIGNLSLQHNHVGKIKFKKYNDKEVPYSNSSIFTRLSLESKHKKFKNNDFSFKVLLNNIKIFTPKDTISLSINDTYSELGFEINEENRSIKNLTLSANGKFYNIFITDIAREQKLFPSKIIEEKLKDSFAYLKVDLGAKYDLHLTDKLTLSSHLNTIVSVDIIKYDKVKKSIFNNTKFEVVRKYDLKYDILKDLTLKADFSAGFNFNYPTDYNGNKKGIEFLSADIKSNVSLVYSW
ncbi:hypothetical protein [Oceanivirga miroungae]|uniref:Uncharacterized protein n=1 Tax=Oceanivirga miroungae TaxID=1130046 RepID=A0A6I8M972_9FUSO|nr:hypothetical protein [Oceanivirga miroungae]VWL84833.1 hypothetical protein OMES3154_00087 [Oceanivirga miroungae]